MIYQRVQTHSPAMSGFEVTSTGACDGHQWDVAWETKGGDRPAMQASGEDLRGSEPQINVENVIDGGVWLRPIRGDMLRLPEYQPQASVCVGILPHFYGCVYICTSEKFLVVLI